MEYTVYNIRTLMGLTQMKWGKLEVRIQEHIKVCQTLTHNHKFENWENVKLLHTENKGFKLTLLDKYENKKHSDNHPNNQINLNFSPIFDQLNLS